MAAQTLALAGSVPAPPRNRTLLKLVRLTGMVIMSATVRQATVEASVRGKCRILAVLYCFPEVKLLYL